MMLSRSAGLPAQLGRLLDVNLRSVIFSLALGVLGCQTISKDDLQAKEQVILDTQKAIVRNALDSGKPESALESLRVLERAHPQDASLHTLMGMTQLALKNAARAVKEFRAAYRLDKQIGNGLNLTSALIEAGEHEHAVHLLLQLIKDSDKSGYAYKERIYHNLGYAYVRQGRLPKAEHWFKQALDENPTFFPTNLELARLYEKSKRPAMAANAYRKSIDYCTVCFEPVQALANLYARQGRSEEARRLLQQYGKIEGVFPSDRTRAGELLNQITVSSLSLPRRG